MDAKNIQEGELYAYVEYPKPYAHVTAQPNPICVRVTGVKGDRVGMERADGRNFLVGSALVQRHYVGSRKIVSTWGQLQRALADAERYDRQMREAQRADAEQTRRQIEEVLPYFEGIEVERHLDLEAYLRRELTAKALPDVTLQAEVIIAVGRRIRELQALAAQHALDESDLEGWTNA